jgi:DNA-binding transcriptional ArsR family regulator
MDEVFKALADPTRRSLLDELFREDGQTLSALEGRLPMSRFGVMKHLGVLEQAGLVVTQKRGREKLHFLNPVPIRLVHDRWVSKYAEPWAAGLSELKRSIEEATMEKVFEVWIKTTPEVLWEAITKKRGEWSFSVPSSGGTLEEDPPRRLVQEMKAEWSDAVKDEAPSRIEWTIAERAGYCQLTIVHSGLREGASDELYGGWPIMLSSLKSFIETGEPLDMQAIASAGRPA